jgi:peptidoglycan/LPS O-acetylase OafA/YrhL
MTLEQRLAVVGQRPSGFDYMRLILASLVMLTHSVVISRGLAAHLSFWGGPLRPFHALILPMFFALSGFLVAGSVERCKTLISFLGLRALRIVPALAVETALSALILGPIFTSHTLQSYFTDWRVRNYFLNIIGHVHFSLPGVYMNNPNPGVVNGQLWTLPYELNCYAILAVLAAIAVFHRPKLLVPAIVLVNIGWALYARAFPSQSTPILVEGGVLVMAFLYGLALFLNRNRVPWSGRLGATAAVAALCCLAWPGLDFLGALPAAYLTVYVGLLNPRRWKLLQVADLSYGVFLYGYPIQQAVIALVGPMDWWQDMLLAYPVTLAFAGVSWAYIEKPALALRGTLLRLEASAIQLVHAQPGGPLILRNTGISVS